MINICGLYFIRILWKIKLKRSLRVIEFLIKSHVAWYMQCTQNLVHLRKRDVENFDMCVSMNTCHRTLYILSAGSYEPPRGKNQQYGFRTGPTQTGLYSYRSRLEHEILELSRGGIVLSE